jgi:hypothetical protein
MTLINVVSPPLVVMVTTSVYPLMFYMKLVNVISPPLIVMITTSVYPLMFIHDTGQYI